MFLRPASLLPIFFCAALTSCVRQVDIDRRTEEPILVVEGSITTDSVPYTVKLSYSGPYKFALDIPQEYLEREAKVTIMDNQGGSASLVHKGSGVYETIDKNYIGKEGKTYRVTIELKNGKKYFSKPEMIQPPVTISNISAKFFDDFTTNYPASLHVFLNSKDPPQQENYYKWDFTTWVLRQTHGIPCGFGCVMYKYCYQKFTNEKVNILSDAVINGNEIKDLDVGQSYIYTYGDHYVDVAQTSLTREAFQFWQRYDEQVSRSGSTLDPLPAPIKGNIYNAADTTEFALGYFSASAVVHRRAILIPFNITDYLLQISAVQFIPEGSKNCFTYFPRALSYLPPPETQYPPPPGWENAQRIEVRW